MSNDQSNDQSIRPYQIVVDTNVLVTAFRSRRGASYKLFTLLKDTRWQVNLSTPLVLEYEEVLKRSTLVTGFSNDSVDVFLEVSVLFPINMIFSICGVRWHATLMMISC